jgi:hypothetical protein
MKTQLMQFCLALGILCLFNQNTYAQHQIKSIVKKNMSALEPYKYDAYALKEITYGPKAQSAVIEFTAYSEIDYKIVFCKTDLPQEVEINIYDKSPTSKTKKLIYFDDSGKKDQYACTFKPASSGQYFIEYKIPPATAPNQKGTMIVLIGIKEGEKALAVK